MSMRYRRPTEQAMPKLRAHCQKCGDSWVELDVETDGYSCECCGTDHWVDLTIRCVSCNQAIYQKHRFE